MADNVVGREAIDLLTKARKEIGEELAQVIVGQTDVVEQVLISMFSQGHCLLEGVPCLLYTSPSPRDKRQSRMPSSA